MRLCQLCVIIFRKEKIANVAALERSYAAMTYYLSTLANAFIKPGDDTPNKPNTSYIQDISNALSVMGTTHEENLEERRKLLLAYLQNHGWRWADMEFGSDTVELKP